FTMNADYRLKVKLFVLAGLLAINVAGCAGSKAYQRGTHAEVVKDYDTAFAEYKVALDKDPTNIEYKLRYERARYNAAFQHFETGRRALEQDDYLTAKMEFTRVLEVDPSHELAQVQLTKVNEILNARNRGQTPPEIQLDRLRDITRTDPSVQSQL